MSDFEPKYIEPTEIELKREDAKLVVTWSDDHVGHTSFLKLRWNCPCAGCRGEMGQPGRLAFIKQLRPEETRMDSMEAVGLYAVRPTWEDGHGTGIYTYEHLRNLCECDICMTEKPNKFDGHVLNRQLFPSRW